MAHTSWIVAWLLALFGALAVITLIVGMRSAMRARLRDDRRGTWRAAAVTGVGAALATACVETMRHYGGSTFVGTTRQTMPACRAWWREIGTPHGLSSYENPSTMCRRAAINAIPGAVGWAMLVGVAITVVTAGLIALARRRQTRPTVGPRTHVLT